MATDGKGWYVSRMQKEAHDLEPLAPSVARTAPAEPGYEAWLRRQLTAAAAELDAPEREEVEHTDVFAELDRIIAAHE
jgi:hypothetical protein